MTNEYLTYQILPHSNVHEFIFHRNTAHTADLFGDIMASIWQLTYDDRCLLLLFDLRASGHLPVHRTYHHLRNLERTQAKCQIVVAFVSYPHMLDSIIRGLMTSIGCRVRFFSHEDDALEWLGEAVTQPV